MSRRRKWAAWIAGSALVALLVFAVTLVLVVRSQWFYSRVRHALIQTVETATGGRVEIASFQFDWHSLRAEVRSFTLHGTEAAGKPPLLHAESVAVGLKLVSLMRRDVDIAYLDVVAPELNLVVEPDGRTNIPQPKVASKPGKPALQSILDLAIGRFSLDRGRISVESRGSTPFSASGSNLNTHFLYELAGRRYRGDISVQPLHLELGSYRPLPVGIATALTIEANRIGVDSAKVTSGASNVAFSGAIENLTAPHGDFKFDASVAVQEATPILRIPELRRGTVQLRGNVAWRGGSDFFAAATLHGTGLAYRDPSIRLEGFRADGALTANPAGVDASQLRLDGDYVTDLGKAPVHGVIAAVALRGKNLQLHDIALSVFGGHFQGEGKVLNLVRYSATGKIDGMVARPVVAMYSPGHMPYNALASGPVNVEGSFENSAELRAQATLTLAPADGSPTVHGQIDVSYEALDRTVQLGTSSLTLPASQIDFSGTLGGQMRVHLETRDLDDLLPAIGERAAHLPAKLTGTAIFDGGVIGNIDDPHISGHTRVTGIEFESEKFDSLEGDAEASPSGVAMRNGTVVQGPMRSQFQMSLGLHEWQADDASPLTGSGTLRGGTVAGLIQLLELKTVWVDGAAAGTAQISGNVGDPHVSADFQLTHGAVRDEPFDRFTGHLNYTAASVEVTGGQLSAGNGQATVQVAYRHAIGHFDTGHLQMRASTNARSLEQIRTFQNHWPGLKGTVQMAADGEADVTPPAAGSDVPQFRITTLNADVTGRGLQISDQALGETHLTASSQGDVLRAHLESVAASSQVRGDGEWRLQGDYPGTATLTFSKLDLDNLRAWLEPAAASTPSPYVGSAEGQLRIDGPLLQPQALKAQLTIPQFTFGPAPDVRIPAAKLMLHNAAPIVASMENNVITVNSARLVGTATDFSLTGKVALQQKSPLDLRGAGRVDLALVHDFNRDFTSAGSVAMELTMRGPLDAPQVNGRTEFQNASFNIEGVPNGISNANGVLVFTGDRSNGTRATIQKFTGDTGGGKIELTGFAGYNNGQTIFRVHARATEVRIRYPEGVSTIANASLNLTGTPDRSNLDGTITIVRTGFNPQSDFSSLLGRSAEPVQTPAARTGLLGGLNFDIQINTAPDVEFQSELTQDVQMEANLRLRGTFSNPALLGRVSVSQGRVIFFGTKYTINSGSVQFFNPVRIDPILDVDLETRVNGIDVTLTVSGPFTKLNLTPRSDPPLQFNEIVALLATGRSPTSDPTRLAQQSTSPQSWQQMGASALLGQALTSPVSGRLQRFFGVSQLRIDPSLPGVENNPQARLTLQQQVTNNITFTYIADINSSNPEVVRVEWSFAKQWSVVALREDNGLFGIDFFYKKRF
ncbi:MAG TPA: translocation/assembly module TamB domain-containing protein [Bryobacteraceae bacterium]|jgi:translocation and assembly module TamB|nr:translocation/assembly module TamB domain-containing protein [Bryobacteraceae bacterium]